MVVGDNLYNYYQDNLIMLKNGFGLNSIMEMIPYEKSIYMGIINKATKKE